MWRFSFSLPMSNVWLFIVGNNYDNNPLSQLIRLQNKAVIIMNDIPLRDHITPHYVY